jgi:GNAT superfamily N-acetyltransferase
MANELQIRQATAEDVETVSAILREAAQWQEQAGMPLWREEHIGVAHILDDVRAGIFVLAEYQGESVGTMKFQLEDPLFWPGALEDEAAYVHRLAVRRRYAGMGVSIALLRWAVERTRALGRPYLRLDCAAARARLRAIYEGSDSSITATLRLGLTTWLDISTMLRQRIVNYAGGNRLDARFADAHKRVRWLTRVVASDSLCVPHFA